MMRSACRRTALLSANHYWHDFVISLREQTKLVAWPSTGHNWSQTSHFGPHHPPSWRNTGSYRVIQHVINVSEMEATLQQAGRVHQVDHGEHVYNKSSRIRTVTWTWSDRKLVIVLREIAIQPSLGGGAAVTEW